jgi:phosphate transport system protein
MRERYIRQLRTIHDDLLRMGSRVEVALSTSVRALDRWDLDLAQEVINNEPEINTARTEIEEKVREIIAMQQPVATDLRVLLAGVAIAGELERVGDYARGIAKRVGRCLQTPQLVEVPVELRRLGTLVQTSLSTALDSYVNMDVTLARTLGDQDEEIDALEDQVVALLLERVRTDLPTLDCVINLLDVAHVLERSADRATNIAERVIFVATANVEEIN